MPVVGGCDDHGVEPWKSEQFAEVGEVLYAVEFAALRALSIPLRHSLDGAVATLLHHIAHRDHFHIALTQQTAQVAASHRTDANEAHVEPIAGRRPSHSLSNACQGEL
jgi:hypothetical protein